MTAELQKGQRLTLSRKTDVISIPFGKIVSLDKGADVEVMQARGTSLSLAHAGRLYLLEGDQRDAVGLPAIPRATLSADADEQALEAFVWNQLRTCYDPEIPVDIVELGLIYGCRIDTLLSGEKMVNIRMTLTAPGCGMGDVIAADARHKIMGASQIGKVHVEVVFDPPWSREMMSEEARLELGMF